MSHVILKIAAVSPSARLAHSYEWRRNWECVYSLLRLIERKQIGLDVLVLPEDFLGWDRAFNAEKVDQLGGIAQDLNCYVVCGGLTSNRNPYKSAWVLGPSGSVSVHHKTFLTGNESRGLQRGGDYDPFDVGKAKIGIAICSEFVFATVGRVLAWKGADVLLWPSTVTLPKSGKVSYETKMWFQHLVEVSLRARAVENGVFGVYVNINQNDKTRESIKPLHLASNPLGELLEPSSVIRDKCGLVSYFDLDLSIRTSARNLVETMGISLPGPAMVKAITALVENYSNQL